MKIGELRDYLSIKRKDRQSDGMGGYASTDKAVISAWCRVLSQGRPGASKVSDIADKDSEIRLYEVAMRYTHLVEINDYFFFEGKTYRVVGIRHDARRRFTFLDCEAEVS